MGTRVPHRNVAGAGGLFHMQRPKGRGEATGLCPLALGRAGGAPRAGDLGGFPGTEVRRAEWEIRGGSYLGCRGLDGSFS